MPLNDRIYSLIEENEGNIGAGSALVNEFKKLLEKAVGSRSLLIGNPKEYAKRAEIRSAYEGGSLSLALKVSFGGGDAIRDLRVLGEFLGIDDPYAVIDDPDYANEIALKFQSAADLHARVAEVGAPSSLAQDYSEVKGQVLDNLRLLLGITDDNRLPENMAAPVINGASRSVDLFVSNFIAENRIRSYEELNSHPTFTRQLEDFYRLIEQEAIASEYTRILNSVDFNDPASFAELEAISLPNQSPAQMYEIAQDAIAAARSVIEQTRLGGDSIVNRTFRQATDSNWLFYTDLDTTVVDYSGSALTEREWMGFLSMEGLNAGAIDFYSNNRELVEEAYLNRADKTQKFFSWTQNNYLPVVQDVVDRFSPVSLNNFNPYLDKLTNAYVQNLPLAFRESVRRQLNSAMATLQVEGNMDQQELFAGLVRGDHGETPTQIVDRYFESIILDKPGGAEFIEAMKAQGLSPTGLADSSVSNPYEWLKSITDNGARAFGLPPVAESTEEKLNQRAFALEAFAHDEEFKNAPRYIQDQIISAMQYQWEAAGVDPLTASNKGQYLQAVNRVGWESIKKNVVEEVILRSGPEGTRLLEELQRRQGASGFYAPDSLLKLFNDLNIDKDTLNKESLDFQLATVAENLGPTPVEAAIAGYANKTRFLPTTLASDANRRIDSFLSSFVGEDLEEVLAREDVQEKIDLIIEGVGMAFFGKNEVVEEAIAAYGGMNAFFEAFPSLQEYPVDDLGEYIVDNFDTIVGGAGENANLADLNRAKRNALAERTRVELQQRRQELENEDEARRLEFDESPQGRQLAALQEQESRRSENVALLTTELERTVRGQITGPNAFQVLQDVSPQLERQFAARRESAFAAGQAGITAQNFLAELGPDYFQRERRRSNIRRTPINVAAPQFAGFTADRSPGFNPLRRGQ